MKLELNLTSNSFIDFAIGAVIKGKEAQVFQEYFPAVASVLKEIEIKKVRSYAVLASNIEGPKPEQGAFSYFKKVENYKEFIKDPRFLKAKPLRDGGMVFLNDGNMFETVEQSIPLDSDEDYALVLSNRQLLQDSVLMQLNLAENSPNTLINGEMLSLYNWNDQLEKLMELNYDSVTVFRVRFFPEQN